LNTQPNSEGAKLSGLTDADALRTGEHTKASTLQGLTGGAGSSTNAGFNKTTVSAGNLVDGKMCAEWVDMIIPGVIVFMAAKGGFILKKADMLMTAKEKDTLAPILTQCLNELMINFDSPWVALAVTAGFMYTGKIMSAKSEKSPGRGSVKPEAAKKSEATAEKKTPDHVQKAADEFEEQKRAGLQAEIENWIPSETEIEARGRSLRQSWSSETGRAKIIKSLRAQRFKELTAK
jgi:hypothetical protein